MPSSGCHIHSSALDCLGAARPKLCKRRAQSQMLAGGIADHLARIKLEECSARHDIWLALASRSGRRSDYVRSFVLVERMSKWTAVEPLDSSAYGFGEHGEERGDDE